MNILIIEDDEGKRRQLNDFFEDNFKDIEISTAKSLQSALKCIINSKYDLILLDMTIPTFDIGMLEDGGRPRVYGGKDVLSQMARRRIPTPVIMVTMFDRFGKGKESLTLKELDDKLKSEYPINYKGSVYYNAAYDDWKQILLSLITKTFKLG